MKTFKTTISDIDCKIFKETMLFLRKNPNLNINVSRFGSLINKGYKIIDVRTIQEYEVSHIENSVLIDIYSPDFAVRISGFDKSGKYLVYCRTGNRSLYAAKYMKKIGFILVLNLSGGIIEWEKSGKPVIKSSDNNKYLKSSAYKYNT